MLYLLSTDRFKPCLGSSGISPALPPKRGRPRLQASLHDLHLVGGRGCSPEVAAEALSRG